MPNLTAVQLEVINAIRRASTEGPRPRPPTVRELARMLGRAPSTIVGHLYRLERLGVIVRDGTPRGLWVVPAKVARLALVEAPVAQGEPGELDRAG